MLFKKKKKKKKKKRRSGVSIKFDILRFYFIPFLTCLYNYITFTILSYARQHNRNIYTTTTSTSVTVDNVFTVTPIASCMLDKITPSFPHP